MGNQKAIKFSWIKPKPGFSRGGRTEPGGPVRHTRTTRSANAAAVEQQAAEEETAATATAGSAATAIPTTDATAASDGYSDPATTPTAEHHAAPAVPGPRYEPEHGEGDDPDHAGGRADGKQVQGGHGQGQAGVHAQNSRDNRRYCDCRHAEECHHSQELRFLSINMRGYHSKREILCNIASSLCLDIIFIQETHLYDKNQINIPGYSVYYRNRPRGTKGGIAVCISDRFKDQTVLVNESKTAEFLTVRICNTIPNLFVSCYYGAQENQYPAHKISDDLHEIFNHIHEESARNNLCLVAGDYNLSIGNSKLTDNNPVMSRGGTLINALLDHEDISLENLKHDGSSITHYDASGGRGKALDLVIANKAASERIKTIYIDNDQIITPYRYNPKSRTRTYTDHVSVYGEMDIKVKRNDSPKKKVDVWNYGKHLGTGKFSFYLDLATNKLVDAMNNGEGMNAVVVKTNKEVRNAKFRGYGKRREDPQRWKFLNDERIAEYRAEEVRKVVDRIRDDKKNFRIPLRVFAARRDLISSEGDMFSSLIHPDSGKEVTSREEIYHATFRHNEITLEQNEGQSEIFKWLTELKLKYVKHAMQQEEDETEPSEYLTWEECLDALETLSARNKSVYDDIKRWGPQFRIFIYWLMRRIFETEDIPDEFCETNLQPLYKQKGGRNDLGNYRFLHLKSTFAKIFEFIVMQKCKEKMYAAFPEAQIGGLPESRTTEHLYVLMTSMLRTEKCKLSSRGFVVIFKDTEKAFDKTSAIHELFSTALAGVRGKVLRILHRLNQRTTFRVVGDPVDRKFVKEYCGGQGTSYTCTGAALSMPQMMDWLVKAVEEKYDVRLGVSLGQEGLIINEMEFVDDECSLCKDSAAARVKAGLITASMNSLNVKCHPTKTKYMIIGDEEYIREQEKDLDLDPIIIQGFKVGRSFEEKYLGMRFNAGGVRETVEGQIRFRFSEGDRKLGEIKTLLEAPTMREFGFLAGVKVLFESIVRSTTLYSSAVWLNMTKAMYKMVEREDKRQIYTLLKINSKTRYYHVMWELSILPYSFAVKKEKVSLITHLCNAKVSQAGRVAMLEAQREWKPGLVMEARKICSEIGLPDPTKTFLSAECISEAIWRGAKRMMFKEIATDRHNLDMSIQRNKPNYIYRDRLSNLEQKLLFSWKLGILQFKSRYKRLYNNQRCILKPCGGIDSLHHLIYECEYLDVERPLNDRDENEMGKFLVRIHEIRTDLGVPLIFL